MQDLGKFLLRLMIGGLLIFYGIHKITGGFTESLTGIGAALDAKGLPAFLKYGVYLGELIAPALLIVGFFTRIAALVLAGNMAVAIFLMHMDTFGLVDTFGGWGPEHPMVFLLGGVCIFLLGPGRIAIDGLKSAD